MINLISPFRPLPIFSLYRTLLLLAGIAVVWVPEAAAQTSLARRLDRLLARRPWNRATWGVLVVNQRGEPIYQRNADRLFVPASTAKLAVTAAASVLLPPDYRITTSVYGTGPLVNGVLRGDLVVYGRGDPGFGAHCYGPEGAPEAQGAQRPQGQPRFTAPPLPPVPPPASSPGVCDAMWTRMDALADSLVARGVTDVAGAIVGDGSYFEGTLVHPDWRGYDLNWGYAAPVSGLGFNDNSVNISWAPGPRVGAPAWVRLEPNLGNFEFENRTRTTRAGTRRTIDFFRRPGTTFIWGEGNVTLRHPGRTEYFALPDPNLYFAQALKAALARRGVGVAGPTRATTDSLFYRAIREQPAMVTFVSRPLGDLLFPLLNSSQNWYAEMLVKLLGRERGTGGSWAGGLDVIRRFLLDSVGLDSAAFSLRDGSGLARGNQITPRAVVQLLAYMQRHANNAAFLRALPRPGTGTLRDRLLCTPAHGRLSAKTGSLGRAYALAGYLDRGGGGRDISTSMPTTSPSGNDRGGGGRDISTSMPTTSPSRNDREGGGGYVFDIVANNHTRRYADGVAQVDSLVLAIAGGGTRMRGVASSEACETP